MKGLLKNMKGLDRFIKEYEHAHQATVTAHISRQMPISQLLQKQLTETWQNW